jgi:PTS system mannitol-specific IIA component/phosphocarrier protein FPr
VRKTTLGVLQFPDGVDWDGQTVRICVAIAAKGNEHVTVLSALAQILMDPAQAEQLRGSASVDAVYDLLESIGKDL